MESQSDDACLQSTQDRKLRIRELNDALRKGRGQGQLFVTPGVIDLANGALPDIVVMVSEFDEFTEENDPHGEHDFGAFTYRGEKLFWKIDYYDRSLQAGSDDPADDAVTMRVLTIMLAREY
ncbi:DUF3768 domain-containing protein [Paraurantiacibacter namhicola]|uniref:DUF3768 domain-containing protein n=1 Tax=Paraurantiacibacter namhicola TaxID=645517 RepID=A0A1C7DB69_9SPHN|nr:DUF3768 domain-containing protein [Paraurantiacibacter namhicola]ANU08695.1 hypothetical protein A6F65_02414 [Paraurantiacibacter namhicola]